MREGQAQHVPTSYPSPHQVFYRVPVAGKYLLCIACRELGAGGGLVPIRGSPFTVEAVDPWQRRRLVGAVPTKRWVRALACWLSLALSVELLLGALCASASQLFVNCAGRRVLVLQGATLCSVGNELVLYGNEKSDGAICHTLTNDDWTWAVGKRGDSQPPFRQGHAAAGAGGEVTLFGGTALEGGAELDDLWHMCKVGPGAMWRIRVVELREYHTNGLLKTGNCRRRSPNDH